MNNEPEHVTLEQVLVERLAMRLAQALAANERLALEVEMLRAQLEVEKVNHDD